MDGLNIFGQGCAGNPGYNRSHLEQQFSLTAKKYFHVIAPLGYSVIPFGHTPGKLNTEQQRVLERVSQAGTCVYAWLGGGDMHSVFPAQLSEMTLLNGWAV